MKVAMENVGDTDVSFEKWAATGETNFELVGKFERVENFAPSSGNDSSAEARVCGSETDNWYGYSFLFHIFRFVFIRGVPQWN